MKNDGKFRIIRVCCLIVSCLLLLTGCKTEKKQDQSCSLTIECSSILSNMEKLTEEKRDLVPEDGFLLKRTEVHFSEGESVFDLLKRTVMEQKIHMEYSQTPVYHSAYIEGIGNLYEFDCGNLSGWKYSVNGKSLSVGCSQYFPEDGDDILFEYYCE